MKKNSFYLLAIMMAAVLCVGFTSCGDDDDDPKNTGNDLVGWYINYDEIITKENCPKNGMEWTDQNGEIHVSESYSSAPPIIHIINDTYLDYYYESEILEKGNEKPAGKDLVYQMDGGNLAYYGTPTRITYYRRTDKEISFVVPDIYESRIFLIKTDKGLEVIDGDWYPKTWLKYDPNKAY